MQKEYDALLLLLGLMLLFYLSMNLSRSAYLIQKTSRPQYLYQKLYFTDGIWSSEMMDEANRMLKGLGVNCIIRDFSLSIGETIDKAEILLCLSVEGIAKKEKLNLSEWNVTPNSVLIEGRMKGRTYVRDKQRFIKMNGLEYPVFGIVAEDEIMGFRVYANWENMDPEHRRVFLDYQDYVHEEFQMVFRGFPIQLQSLTAMQEKADVFEKCFQGKLHVASGYSDGVIQDRTNLYQRLTGFYAAMEFFVLAGFYYLCDLWFKKRKREYLIRRMLGCGFLRLWGRVIMETGLVTVLALAGALMIGMLQYGMHVAGNLLWQEMLATSGKAFLMVIVMEFLTYGIYVSRLTRIYPTQENIESAA